MKLEEVWKDITDYPNYQVSNYGRVKSKERYTKQRNGTNLRKEKLRKIALEKWETNSFRKWRSKKTMEYRLGDK